MTHAMSSFVPTTNHQSVLSQSRLPIGRKADSIDTVTGLTDPSKELCRAVSGSLIGQGHNENEVRALVTMSIIDWLPEHFVKHSHGAPPKTVWDVLKRLAVFRDPNVVKIDFATGGVPNIVKCTCGQIELALIVRSDNRCHGQYTVDNVGAIKAHCQHCIAKRKGAGTAPTFFSHSDAVSRSSARQGRAPAPRRNRHSERPSDSVRIAQMRQ